MELPVEHAAAIDVMAAELEQAGLTVFTVHVARPLYSRIAQARAAGAMPRHRPLVRSALKVS